MKCKMCHAELSSVDIQKGRCPYCGAAAVPEARKMPLILWVIVLSFLLVGIMGIIGGTYSAVQYEQSKAYLTEVDAEIVEIRREETYDSVNDETDVDYTVFVDYEYDGVLYQHVELSYHKSSMRSGDIVQVQIDSRNPGEVVVNNWWIILVGVALFAVGAVPIYLVFKPGKKE